MMRKASPFDPLRQGLNPAPKLKVRAGRIFRLGTKLIRNNLSSDERLFLGQALQRIADGQDPYVVLDLAVDKPGQRRKGAYVDEVRKVLAIGWIAASLEGGLKKKPSVGDVIKQAAKHFGYEETTMKKMWAESPKSGVVTLP